LEKLITDPEKSKIRQLALDLLNIASEVLKVNIDNLYMPEDT